MLAHLRLPVLVLTVGRSDPSSRSSSERRFSSEKKLVLSTSFSRSESCCSSRSPSSLLSSGIMPNGGGLLLYPSLFRFLTFCLQPFVKCFLFSSLLLALFSPFLYSSKGFGRVFRKCWSVRPSRRFSSEEKSASPNASSKRSRRPCVDWLFCCIRRNSYWRLWSVERSVKRRREKSLMSFSPFAFLTARPDEALWMRG